MHIQLISTRPNHVDHPYQTGEWDFEQIKDVPDDIGLRMLQHHDVYAAPKSIPQSGVQAVKIDNIAETEAQDIEDKISLMSKNEARDFIERNFGQKVDLRNFKTEDAIRAHAKMLFNQFGVK